MKKLPSDLRDADGPNQPVAAYKCTEVSILWTLMYREDCAPVVVRNGTVLKSQDVAVTKAMNAAVGEANPDGVPLGEGWESSGGCGAVQARCDHTNSLALRLERRSLALPWGA